MSFHHAARRLGAIVLLSCLTSAGLPASPATAVDAGWRSYEVPASAENPAIPVALFYPTDTPARAVAMGPYTLQVAPMAPAANKLKGLIIVSHGTGGSELGHHGLAGALARDGYLVAALRHPGDNYTDRSLWQQAPGAIFIARPPQVSRVIDALLADPAWRDRIAADARGPMVGVVGHSAGGFTAIALAGGRIDLFLIRNHCQANRAEDPIFCGMGGGPAALAPAEMPSTADPRVRAIVALAPVGVVFTAPSLQAIQVPTLIYGAEQDRWLPPRFHAARVAQNVPGAQLQIVPGAWHFAFMDKLGIPVPTPDGDANDDAPGFDRGVFLARLNAEVPAFFDRALRSADRRD